MKKLKIAIIDVIGLPYDGTTLTKKGIGGSESSIISIARELSKLDFDVTVFNDNNKEGASEGIYDGVSYKLINRLKEKDYNFDIVISQRTVVPFTPPELYDQVRQPPPRDHDVSTFDQLRRPHQLKIVWLQDTFCWGDHILEQLVVDNHINELFVLSDWHFAYTTHSQHGPRRNVEVLKNKIFLTRNAINRWIDWVDIKDKDPNLFVYNASVTKGMVPLLERIWPRLKNTFKDIKLKIIGGYYQFPNEPLNDQGKTVLRLQEQFRNDPSVEFTGIITQPEIAKIVAKANFLIYPGAFPETHGIATLEAINYNTPVIGTRFGAMEETATSEAGYFIDYAIEPNSLFPNINIDEQVEKFYFECCKAYTNQYLHQQKKYSCNQVKDVSTWDTVALQWKQHFYHKFGFDLNSQEYNRVKWINYRVHKVFGRRILNQEEIEIPKITTDNNISYKDLKVAFIDIQGMAYDGATLTHRGLGGSESAVILVANELANLGCRVTVFNACNEDDAKPGIYNNVEYRPVTDLANRDYTCDVLIGSRTILPFVSREDYHLQLNTVRKYPYSIFETIRDSAKLKVFWMHDTFSWGDEHLEPLVVKGSIDEIWCLSDFHSMYVMNCNHGSPRNYEVLRRKMWITRNGISKYNIEAKRKDPNLFFFNANMSKGLGTLLHTIWPSVKRHIPSAKLKVIGGFYKLGSVFSDDQEAEFKKVVGDKFTDPSIEFMGVISQQKVAEVCQESSYFIYPAELPETYGISTLESLYANTPLITCRFGALEETATEDSWMIDYAIVPNGLYPTIDPNDQAKKFVDMVIRAYNDKQELERRQKSLDNIKELAGWNVVAFQWKHRMFHRLGLNLTRAEFQRSNYYTLKYNKLFKRRFIGLENITCPKIHPENKIVVITPFWNSKNYIQKCIESVAAQDYDNYEHYLIDDGSNDGGYELAEQVIAGLDTKSKIHLIKNQQRLGSAVANQILTIKHNQINDDDIIMLLDGDDWLENRYDIFTYYNELHQNNDFVYGSCWSEVDNIPLISQPYPPEIKQTKSYRSYKFNWGMPYTHLRTFKAKLIKYIDEKEFKDQNGNWFKAGGDNSTFYLPLENCDPKKIAVNSDITYRYNDTNPLNDYKINGKEQNITADMIVGNVTELIPNLKTAIMTNQPTDPLILKDIMPNIIKHKKRILIAIPNKVGIEVETFKSLYDLEVPEGYETTFQYYYGYQVEQVRNLIAHWVVSGGWDYLFSVDSDISMPQDTLRKFIEHDKDMVCGLYIQRIPGKHTIEVMRNNSLGGVSHVPYEDIKGKGLVEVDACGFGCVLIKREVFTSSQYPWFEYKSSLDHQNTISEDIYFCKQAKQRGFRIWADTTVLCDHIGSWTFKVEDPLFNQPQETELQSNLRSFHQKNSLPNTHLEYLQNMKNQGYAPRVIYDIGSGILQWTKYARMVWPEAKIICFEAMQDIEFLYKEQHLDYHIGLLSDHDNKFIKFYENVYNCSGNSYYKENSEFSPHADILFTEQDSKNLRALTLDTVINFYNFPTPDLVLIDVQGSEIDIFKGGEITLKNCSNIIMSVQHVEYNKGAPIKNQVVSYMNNLGFNSIQSVSENINMFDADYHFSRVK